MWTPFHIFKAYLYLCCLIALFNFYSVSKPNLVMSSVCHVYWNIWTHTYRNPWNHHRVGIGICYFLVNISPEVITTLISISTNYCNLFLNVIKWDYSSPLPNPRRLCSKTLHGYAEICIYCFFPIYTYIPLIKFNL